MSLEQSTPSKSTPAALMQDGKTGHAPIAIKSSMGATLSTIAQGTTPPQGTASSAGIVLNVPSPIAPGPSPQSASKSDNRANELSSIPASGAVAKKSATVLEVKNRDFTTTPETPLDINEKTSTPSTALPAADPASDASDEAQLAGKVVELWTSHAKREASVKRTTSELKILRTALAAKLYELKDRYCRAGRDGEWSGFLTANAIPRTSADRHVARHKKSITSEPASCPTGATKEPTSEDVVKLVKKLKPKLEGVLTSPESVSRFLMELAKVLQPLEVAK
jgi:hypothetical protein